MMPADDRRWEILEKVGAYAAGELEGAEAREWLTREADVRAGARALVDLYEEVVPRGRQRSSRTRRSTAS